MYDILQTLTQLASLATKAKDLKQRGEIFSFWWMNFQNLNILAKHSTSLSWYNRSESWILWERKKKICSSWLWAIEVNSHKWNYWRFQDSNFWHPFFNSLGFISSVILKWHLPMHKSGQSSDFYFEVGWEKEI